MYINKDSFVDFYTEKKNSRTRAETASVFVFIVLSDLTVLALHLTKKLSKWAGLLRMQGIVKQEGSADRCKDYK